MRELMPFTKGKKLFDETGSDLTPKPGIEGTQITGNLAYSMFDQSGGSVAENKIKKILDEVTEYTPQQFLKRYSQQDYNLMTSMLEDAGYGKATKNKAGNVTNFTLNPQFKGQGIGGSKIKSFDKFDLPPELQNVGTMNWEKYSEPTEKYIPGVTDKTVTVDNAVISADTGIFDEGSQNRHKAALEDDVKVLEDTIAGFSEDDYNRPISASNTTTEGANRLARQNKARMRAGLEPVLKPTELINPAMDEFADMSIGDYYTNQLIAKKAELEELKISMGPGSEELRLQNLLDKTKLGRNLSFGETVSTTQQVARPTPSKENPITKVTESKDIIESKVVGGESGPVGPDYARGGKKAGKNIFLYQSKGKSGLGAIVASTYDAIEGMAKIETYFENAVQKSKGEPSAALAKAVNDLESIKRGWRQAAVAAGFEEGTLKFDNYVKTKTYEDIVANVERKDLMQTGTKKIGTIGPDGKPNNMFPSSPSFNAIIEEAERTGVVSGLRGALSGTSVDPTPMMQAEGIASQINLNRVGAMGLSPEENAKILFPRNFPEAVTEIKASPEAKNAGEVIDTKQIHSAFTIDSVELVKNNAGNYEIKHVVRSSPYSSALEDKTRIDNYGANYMYDHGSQSHTINIDTTGIEPEGYDPLTKNKVVPLTGESASQAGKRAAVLAKVSGWDFESGAWKAHSDVNAYAGRQRTLRTLVDQGAINPNDIAWNAINDDIDAGTFDSSNIKKYLKLSGATDTAASALKTSVNIKSSSRKGTVVTIGSSKVPVVKTAKEMTSVDLHDESIDYDPDAEKSGVTAKDQTSPYSEHDFDEKYGTNAPDSGAGTTGNKFTVDALTDDEIMKLPAYRDLRNTLGASEELKNLRPEALDKITLTRTRSILKELSKQETAATKGFAKMIETIIKSR